MYKIPATTLFFGKKLIFMPECHSTNDEMLLLCQKGLPTEGSVIVTAQQTAGRGQRGNAWSAEPGKNLTFTLLINPSFLPIQKQFYLNIFVSLGIRDYLTENEQLKVQIKWPNDIVFQSRKICGILIENQIAGTTISASIVGIGLNINQQDFNIAQATSLLLECGRETDLNAALDSLLGAIEARYLQLRAGKWEQLRRDYLSHLFLIGQSSTFLDSEGEFTGMIEGIDDTGRLLVLKDGTPRAY
ncbi:MAG TPA: biotin--[acetyl-CoA-carboxylase] ligase, partial [Sphingobacteriaceae bacterium]